VIISLRLQLLVNLYSSLILLQNTDSFSFILCSIFEKFLLARQYVGCLGGLSVFVDSRVAKREM